MVTAIQEYVTSWTAEVRPFIAGRRVFAIIDPAVEDSFQIVETLNALSSRSTVTLFTEFTANPSWEALGAALETARSAKAESVLAIGGGTSIDLAKLTAMALRLGGIDALWKAIETEHELKSLCSDIPLMAIPTTAGTGAEATQFAVLYRAGIKHSLNGEALKPDAFALDPSLLTSLPPSVVADAGLDAACQAMESLWSVRSTPVSEEAAWVALDLAIANLKPAVCSPDDASLAGMLVSAHLAGKAINLTTTTAPHALSYGLTSVLGIPHGRAVALLLGLVFKRTLTSKVCRHPQGFAFVEGRLEEIATRWQQTIDGFPDWWAHYLHDQLRIPKLAKTTKPPPIDQLTASVNARRLANHPTEFIPNEIREIYRSLFHDQLSSST